jgi:hypothetical protein
MCTRSLLCKKHSVEAKRSVLGRSLPYHDLFFGFGFGEDGRSYGASPVSGLGPALEDKGEEGLSVVR